MINFTGKALKNLGTRFRMVWGHVYWYWKDGLMSGQGTYYFADGDKYVGEHMNNNRYGQGTYYFADGAYDVGIKGRCIKRFCYFLQC